jgi:C_GCAxxG_C_C family probable redox protein
MNGSADREALLDKVYTVAFAYERDNGCCAQCVLAAVQDLIGVGSDEVFTASHALSAGGALTTQGTCGALAGAMLAVGSVHGRTRQAFGEGPHQQAFVLAKRVHEAFVAEFGSPLCSEVQTRVMGRSFDMWNGDDFRAFLAAGGHEDKCPHVVGTAARIAADLLV